MPTQQPRRHKTELTQLSNIKETNHRRTHERRHNQTHYCQVPLVSTLEVEAGNTFQKVRHSQFPRKSRAFPLLEHLVRVCSPVVIDGLFQVRSGKGLFVIINIIRPRSDEIWRRLDRPSQFVPGNDWKACYWEGFDRPMDRYSSIMYRRPSEDRIFQLHQLTASQAFPSAFSFRGLSFHKTWGGMAQCKLCQLSIARNKRSPD